MLGCTSSKTTTQLFYSYEKDTDKDILLGPVKQIQQFGKINTTNGLNKKDDKFKYYSASFSGRRFNEGGTGFYKYDTLGMVTWRQSLRDSINQKYYDTLKKHRMRISKYIYNDEDMQNKLQYKQTKKKSRFVHNPYRVKIPASFYQVYKMKVEKDSTYKRITHQYKYYKDDEGKIIKEEYYNLWDKDLNDVIERKDLEYTAIYIYNKKGQLASKEYNLTPKYPGSVSIDDFEFDDIPDSYNPVIKYKWDDRGNLIKVSTHPDKDRPTYNHIEKYWYNKKNQLIKMRRVHPSGIIRSYNKHIRNIYDLYFDERSNVIKIESIDDDEKTIHATYLYDYGGYDSYNNWTTSKSYLKGEKKPFIVTKRVIEYY
jgi:hypothetical protein